MNLTSPDILAESLAIETDGGLPLEPEPFYNCSAVLSVGMRKFEAHLQLESNLFPGAKAAIPIRFAEASEASKFFTEGTEFSISDRGYRVKARVSKVYDKSRNTSVSESVGSQVDASHQVMPSERFIVYFDSKAYIRKQLRNVIVGVAFFGAIFFIAWMNHKVFPEFIVVSFFALPPVIVFLDFLSHLAHHREYMGDDDAKKEYLEFNALGVKAFHESSFSWDSISSVELVEGTVHVRGGKVSWLLLIFKDGKPLSELAAREFDRLTLDNPWVKAYAKSKYPVLKENNFVSLRVAGGDNLASNLTVCDAKIEFWARRYFSFAKAGEHKSNVPAA